MTFATTRRRTAISSSSVMSSQGMPLDVVADAAFPETVASGKDYRVVP